MGVNDQQTSVGLALRGVVDGTGERVVEDTAQAGALVREA
jgi:hypothetical protein